MAPTSAEARVSWERDTRYLNLLDDAECEVLRQAMPLLAAAHGDILAHWHRLYVHTDRIPGHGHARRQGWEIC